MENGKIKKGKRREERRWYALEKRSLTLVRDDLEPFALYPSHGD